MSTIAERCEALALEARRIALDVAFRSTLTASRPGELTMTHVDLEGARLAITRAKEAVDLIAAEAEAIRTGKVAA